MNVVLYTPLKAHLSCHGYLSVNERTLKPGSHDDDDELRDMYARSVDASLRRLHAETTHNVDQMWTTPITPSVGEMWTRSLVGQSYPPSLSHTQHATALT